MDNDKKMMMEKKCKIITEGNILLHLSSLSIRSEEKRKYITGNLHVIRICATSVIIVCRSQRNEEIKQKIYTY